MLKKIDNLQIFSSYNLDISETSPRDIILLRILRGICSSNYKILVAPIKVRDKIFCLQPAVDGMVSRDRLVVRTLRCGRSNPGSNPGRGMSFLNSFYLYFPKVLKK